MPVERPQDLIEGSGRQGPDRLEQIRARAKAAAPGPWTSHDSEQSWSLHAGPMQILKAHKSCKQHAEYWPYPSEADFIVHCREDIDYLLGLIDAAERNEETEYGQEVDEPVTDLQRRFAQALDEADVQRESTIHPGEDPVLRIRQRTPSEMASYMADRIEKDPDGYKPVQLVFLLRMLAERINGAT